MKMTEILPKDIGRPIDVHYLSISGFLAVYVTNRCEQILLCSPPKPGNAS